MNTKLVMSSSALLMALIGVSFTFLPDEILQATDAHPLGSVALLLQGAGAVYIGFGMLNWLSKSMLMGGIYSRPLALGNFLHFAIGALTLVKGIVTNPNSLILSIAAVLYFLFAVLFGLILFRHPLKQGRMDELSPV